MPRGRGEPRRKKGRRKPRGGQAVSQRTSLTNRLADVQRRLREEANSAERKRLHRIAESLRRQILKLR